MDTSNIYRAEILVRGRVQGVGFRYFVLRSVERLKSQGHTVHGYTRNLADGGVFTVVEGSRTALETLYGCLQQGPPSAHIETHHISWQTPTGEFATFDIRR
jgi:acylphosphatase